MSQLNNRYQGLAPELANELQFYESKYFQEDKPVPFCGMDIYPVKMHDYNLFFSCVDVLTLDKNKTPQGIKMTNLDYLRELMYSNTSEGNVYSYKLYSLLELIFHVQNGLKCSNCHTIVPYTSQEFKDYLTKIQELQSLGVEKLASLSPSDIPKCLCPKCQGEAKEEIIAIRLEENSKHYALYIDGHKISSADFNRLRQIVLFQNMPDYFDDSWVDASLRADRMAKLELQQKAGADVQASTERKMVCLSIATNYKLEEIYEMSVRKFTIALGAVEDLINYKIMKTALMSGFVKMPKDNKIEHWIYKKPVDIYGDSYKDTEQTQSSLSNL